MSLIPAGTPLVLVNAFPLDKTQWEPMVAELLALEAPLGDIIMFDVPGIGDMPLPQEEPSLELIADAATLAMREVTGERAALWVGCSMGGYIAMAVAERHADAVAGLVLIGTKASADSPQALAKRREIAESLDGKPGTPDSANMAENLVGTQGEARKALISWITATIARQSGDGIAWGQRAMAKRPDRLAVLAGLDVPAAVVHGALDPVASAADAEAMAGALGTHVDSVGHAGHVVALDDPGYVAQVIARVVREIAPPRKA